MLQRERRRRRLPLGPRAGHRHRGQRRDLRLGRRPVRLLLGVPRLGHLQRHHRSSSTTSTRPDIELAAAGKRGAADTPRPHQDHRRHRERQPPARLQADLHHQRRHLAVAAVERAAVRQGRHAGRLRNRHRRNQPAGRRDRLPGRRPRVRSGEQRREHGQRRERAGPSPSTSTATARPTCSSCTRASARRGAGPGSRTAAASPRRRIEAGMSGATEARFLPMDVNGDGRTDVVEVYPNFLWSGIRTWISNGTGFAQGSNNAPRPARHAGLALPRHGHQRRRHVRRGRALPGLRDLPAAQLDLERRRLHRGRSTRPASDYDTDSRFLADGRQRRRQVGPGRALHRDSAPGADASGCRTAPGSRREPQDSSMALSARQPVLAHGHQRRRQDGHARALPVPRRQLPQGLALDRLLVHAGLGRRRRFRSAANNWYVAVDVNGDGKIRPDRDGSVRARLVPAADLALGRRRLRRRRARRRHGVQRQRPRSWPPTSTATACRR